MTEKKQQEERKSRPPMTLAEWEQAYNALAVRYDKLRDVLRGAIQILSKVV